MASGLTAFWSYPRRSSGDSGIWTSTEIAAKIATSHAETFATLDSFSEGVFQRDETLAMGTGMASGRQQPTVRQSRLRHIFSWKAVLSPRIDCDYFGQSSLISHQLVTVDC